MSKQEELLKKLESDLKIEVEKYFDSIDKFENKFILNSRISKDSPFEQNTFCSGFDLVNLKDLQIANIILGDLKEISVFGQIKVATWESIPKRGKELNSWSSSVFGIIIDAKVLFNKEDETIEISNVKVRGR